jgi:hypothetical protein
MYILYLSHSQILTLIAVDHHRKPRIVGVPGIVVRIRLIHIDRLQLSLRVSREGRELTVAFVDGVGFGDEGRIDVFIKGIDIRHLGRILLYFTLEIL